ncbi:MAG: class I SAM-dependent methyltransferase, partial [Candidatus Korobacteraceae bacterium]
MGSWSGHLAFANDLISAIQPSLLVELGTHWGEAYFTFCQTVEEQQLSCTCYAVDQWQGDEHVGRYGEEVFDDVNEYNNRYYGQFSYLLRRSFDDALSKFQDGSIDLLHIDGLHTYEAVSHDFRSWLPKVSNGGIILLQDISLRHADFGVWRLWDEIKAEFPDTFEFHHSWGLGVIAKGSANRSSTLTELLFDGSPSARENLRRHYVIYASHLENILGRFPLAVGRSAPDNGISDIRVQVFPYG